MKSRLFSLAVSFFAAAACANAAETPVKIEVQGRDLAAILNLPEGTQSPPVVLMLHGFTGQKDEFPIAKRNTGLFAYTAQELARKGIATLRIDFEGSGASNGEWKNTSFSSQIADAVAAFDYLQANNSVNGGKVGILGYSQGGLVGAHLAAVRPEAAAVVLWAPVTNPMATYSHILGSEAVSKGIMGDAKQEITTNLSWGGQTTLLGSFYKELPLANPTGAIGKYHGPLRVIVGTRETIVTPQPAAGQSILNYHEGIEDLVEVDSDHDYGAETSPDLVESTLVPKTAEWFVDHM